MQLSANIKTYWLLLKDLSNEEKRSLIKLLTQSIKSSSTRKREPGVQVLEVNNVKHILTSANKKGKPEKQEKPGKDEWVDSFYGSWNDTPETAEELIQLIEGARTTGRPVETL